MGREAFPIMEHGKDQVTSDDSKHPAPYIADRDPIAFSIFPLDLPDHLVIYKY
jgi:hypothetical protein